MRVELALIAITAALNVAAVLLWLSGRYRVVVSPPRTFPARRAAPQIPRAETAASPGRGERRLAADLERFRRQLQENPSC
jgi:hypothetical protein